MRQLPSVILSFAVLGCSVGRQHTPDAILERNFSRHRAEFDDLRRYTRADEKLDMVSLKELSYGGHMIAPVRDVTEIARLGMDQERWTHYQVVLRQLGLVRIFRSERGVVFVADPPSLWNGDSTKGYWHDDRPPGRELGSLDAYRISEGDHGLAGYRVSKRIRDNWYLYLFVSD